MTAGWRRWLRIWRRNQQTDIDAELAFHLEARVEALIAGGATAGAARAQALEEFGDLQAVRTRLGDIDRRIAERHRRAEWWEGIAQDLRHTTRSLARSPGFTVMVVMTLALGIGANAAVFSVLNRLFLQAPAGVPNVRQLRRLEVHYRWRPSAPLAERGVLSYPEYRALTSAAPETELAGSSFEQEHLGSGPGAPVVNVSSVVGDYFGLLGVRAARGRMFRSEELAIDPASPIPDPVAVISDALWHARFGADTSIVGKPLVLGVHRFTVIGVAPGGFLGTELNAADVWLPLNTEGSWKNPKGFHLFTSEHTGFIQPIVHVPDDRAAARFIGEATPVLRVSGMTRDSLATVTLPSLAGSSPEFVGQQGAIAVRLAGVAAIILLLACANVANLMLARGMRRRREIAIRLALGVSRKRLIAQLMAESVVVAMIAGVVALLVGLWSAGALRHALLPDVSWGAAAMNSRVAAFTALVAVVTALAAGLIPALQSASPDLNSSLKSGGLNASPAGARTRAALMVVQAALSVVLLAGAGLFVRSLDAVKGIDVGYDTNLTILASAHYDTDAEPAGGAQRAVRLAQVADGLRRSPAIAAVGMAENAPMESISFEDLFLPDRDSIPTLNGTQPLAQFVSPGFFQASGVRVVKGRAFSDADRAGAEQVVVVSESMAKTFWPNADAIGKCVIIEKRTDACRRVVGIVTDEHVVDIVESTMMHIFIPLAQSPDGGAVGEIVVRAATGRVDAAAAGVRRQLVRAFGPDAIPSVEVMRDVLAPQLRPWRLGALLFSAAGLVALLVAAIGIFSAMSYSVSQRTREIGIRMALGARGVNVARLIVGQGIRVVIVGVLLGVVAAIALGRLVASLLDGVTPHDPVVLSATAVTLVLVAVVACLIPARRAARVDPMETLRTE